MLYFRIVIYRNVTPFCFDAGFYSCFTTTAPSLALISQDATANTLIIGCVVIVVMVTVAVVVGVGACRSFRNMGTDAGNGTGLLRAPNGLLTFNG